MINPDRSLLGLLPLWLLSTTETSLTEFSSVQMKADGIEMEQWLMQITSIFGEAEVVEIAEVYVRLWSVWCPHSAATPAGSEKL